jgi:hypothetical protein
MALLASFLNDIITKTLCEHSAVVFSKCATKVHYLPLKLGERPLSFGSVVVFSCMASCSGEMLVEEFVHVAPDPDDSLLKSKSL